MPITPLFLFIFLLYFIVMTTSDTFLSSSSFFLPAIIGCFVLAVKAADALARLEASGKPDKGNKANDLVSTTTALHESLTQEVKVTVRLLCAFELNRILVHMGKTLAKATIKIADEMEAMERKLTQSWIQAANSLDTGSSPESTWDSVMTRLKLHGAVLDDSWVSAFDASSLDNSSNI
jgi:hypothetical protein